MKVDYKKLKFSRVDKQLYGLTVLDNPYIPAKIKPFPKQAAAIMHPSTQKLLGGNAFSGKSTMGAVIASQYLMYPQYRCLIVRRTHDDVVATGGIVDTLKEFLLDEKRLGMNVCTLNEVKKKFTAPSGAEIWYNEASVRKDKEKFRGRSYHCIIVDEATELLPETLRFFNRSIRKEKDDPIPLHIYYISNPSSSDGTKFLLEEFVEDYAPHPYFELTFWDNESIDPYQYAKNLEMLDPIDRAYQLYGDWHFVPSNGMIITRQELMDMHLPQEYIDVKTPDYNIIGVDLASTGEDKTALVSIAHFTDGTTAIVDSLTIKSSSTEEPIRRFLEKQQQMYRTNIICFEKEQGASPEYAKRYWYGILKDLLQGYGTRLTFYHPTDSKFDRARPIAQGIRRGFLHINKSLPDLESLQNQFLYVHPDKEKMKEFPSPDVLDAASLCFNQMTKVYSLGTTELSKSYNMRVV